LVIPARARHPLSKFERQAWRHKHRVRQFPSRLHPQLSPAEDFINTDEFPDHVIAPQRKQLLRQQPS